MTQMRERCTNYQIPHFQTDKVHGLLKQLASAYVSISEIYMTDLWYVVASLGYSL